MTKLSNAPENSFLERQIAKTLFRSVATAFYVDIQHNWYKCMRWPDRIPLTLPSEGIYSIIYRQFINNMIPVSHKDEFKLKFSPEYIQKHLSPTNDEYYIDIPLTLSGEDFWIRFLVTLIDTDKENNPHHVIVYAKNITSVKTTEFSNTSQLIHAVNRINRQLVKLAETDGLTGINNRLSGERKIVNLLEMNVPGSLCVLDCDNFKQINDQHGHYTGDRILIAIATALTDCLTGPHDIIMRLGGDEFAFFIPNITTEAQLRPLMENFFAIIAAIPITHIGINNIHTSVGATFYLGKEATTFDELYCKADKGLYQSKKIDGNFLTIK